LSLYVSLTDWTGFIPYDKLLSPGDARFTKCTQTLKPSDWNSRTHEAVTEFEVLAERDSKNDRDKTLAVHFATLQSRDAPEVFMNYTLPNLPVSNDVWNWFIGFEFNK
jgi:hypothetical protein